MFSLGSDEATGLAIKTWRRSEHPCWYLLVEDCAVGQELLAEDLPDALDLLARWAPVVQASAVTTIIQDCSSQYGLIEKLLRRIENGRWPN